MRKIQEIKLNKYIELEPLIPMYCRGTVSIITEPDGTAKLRKGEGFDFLTYFNSLPVGKWRKYSKAENFYLVMDISGRFDLDLVGHLPKDNGHQKEWGGRFSFDIGERKEIVIPIPRTMRSELVSFGMNIYDDTYVYDAYYATDIDEKLISQPHISLVTNVSENSRILTDSIERLKEGIFCDDSLKNCFDWLLIDIEENLPADCMSSGINVAKAAEEIEKALPSGTHVVVADEKNVLYADCLKRLYWFLSMLKDEYKSYEITGAAFSDEKANLQTDIYFEEDANKESCIASRAVVKNTDMGIWSNIIDNESASDKKRYMPGFFYCVPLDRFDLNNVLVPEDVSGTGYTLIRPLENSIRISGVCTWVPQIKELLEQTKTDDNNKTVLKLQDIVFPGEIELEVTKNMYYRSDGHVSLDRDIEADGSPFSFVDGRFYDFFTYFNAFSLEKWNKYTNVENVYLMLEAKGDFSINLFGHFKSKIGYQKEWFGDHHYNLDEKEKIIIPYPRGMQSSLIAFGITAHRNLKIYKAGYITEIEKDKIKSPLISMVTTTFKKENFIERNIALMTDQLLSDEEYKNYFRWYIIDNGMSVEAPKDLNDRIKIIPNKNVGGAGGFAKGQMESIRGDQKTTHILFMDDDVVFIPDSFKKLCNLLKVIKDEYGDHFISGAMLKTGQPNIQHENTGWLNDLGNNESLKTNVDLNLWNEIINNEEINDSLPNRFAAFWFCCVPTTVATMDNLPLPVFFRGDDIEYSLRNKAKIITMNGLCIWHEGFEGRFSASLDFYLTVRNKLMLCAINPHLNEIDMIGNIEENFWEEMRKYDYKGASFFLDAVEDFLKGPEFYRNSDGEANMKEKKAQDNELKPINPEIRGKIDFANLYFAEPLSDTDMEKYVNTYNNQDTGTTKKAKPKGNVNEKSMYGSGASVGKYKKKKVGVIPYGWGTWPSKVYKMDEVIAVDPANDTYVIYKKDADEFDRLKERFEKLKDYYEKNGEKIIKDYQKAREELSGEKFWDDYLKM